MNTYLSSFSFSFNMLCTQIMGL